MSDAPFTKPFEHNVLSHALRANPRWPIGLDALATAGEEDRARYRACEAFAEALRRHRVAEAKLTISLDAGGPGAARDMTIDESRDATEALKAAYLAAREHDVVREGTTPRFITHEDAIAIACALNLESVEGMPNFARERHRALTALFSDIGYDVAKTPADLLVR